MNKSEGIAELAKALAKFQGEVTNPKNTADNPFYKSKYTPLQDVLNVVRPLLSKHGLSVIQAPSGDGTHISIKTILLHESGEWIEFDPLILKAEKITPQGAGSCITYGRRYALSAVVGVASEDDDDANSLEGSNVPQENQLSPKQLGLIKTLVKKIAIAKQKQDEEVYEALKISDITKLTSQQASEVIQKLNKWVDQLDQKGA